MMTQMMDLIGRSHITLRSMSDILQECVVAIESPCAFGFLMFLPVSDLL